MHKNSLLKMSIGQASGTILYVMLVAGLMFNGEAIFGQMQSYWAPVAFLLLFVVSAAITGYLVLGRSILMYWDGLKKEAMQLAMMTVGWLALVMILILLSLAVF